MKTPAERRDWILEYLRVRQEACGSTPYHVDVLNAYFVDDYVEATGAKAQAMPYGAAKCPMLGADLSALFQEGKLRRSATGIGDGLCHQGFPRWVYTYKL